MITTRTPGARFSPAVIDTTRAELAVLARAGAPDATMTAIAEAAVSRALAFLAMSANIAASRFNADREREELAELLATTTAALRDEQLASDRRIDAETADRLVAEEAERAQRGREGRTLRDVISLDRLRETDSADELLALVRDAERAGPTLGAEAKSIAIRRAQTEAAREQRHELAGSGKWFRALCALRTQTSRAGAHDLHERGEQRKKQARDLIARIAEVAGIYHLRQPAAPTPEATTARPTMTAGSWFDRFKASGAPTLNPKRG